MTSERAPHATHTTYRSRLAARLRRFDPVARLPEQTRAHLRAARREQLLALRSLLDAAIARLERRTGERG